nr:MAG TPA: hypothetical protein [Caudoviricetes sp.]
MFLSPSRFTLLILSYPFIYKRPAELIRVSMNLIIFKGTGK